MVSKEAHQLMLDTRLSEANRDYVWHRLGLFANCNLIDGIPKLGGFYSLYLKEELELGRVFYGQTHYLNLPLADFLGASHYSLPNDPTSWTNRTRHLPLLTAGQAPRFETNTTALNRLVSPNFAPADEVLLPLEARGQVKALDKSQITVRDMRIGSQHLEATVEAAKPGWLVIAQSYSPCWKSWVDGEPTRVWQANYAFQALEVPAGRHRIVVRYQDPFFLAGVTVAIAGLELILAGLWVTRLPVHKPALSQ
jgi:hypothetical protein